MGVIDQAQNVVVEVGGMIVFLAGVAGIAAPVVGFDPQLGVAGPVVALVIGLYKRSKATASGSSENL